MLIRDDTLSGTQAFHPLLTDFQRAGTHIHGFFLDRLGSLTGGSHKEQKGDSRTQRVIWAVSRVPQGNAPNTTMTTTDLSAHNRSQLQTDRLHSIRGCLIALALGVMACARSTGATYEHQGDADPLTEGWLSPGVAAGNVTWGPVNSAGVPAWSIDDADTVPQSTKSYVVHPSAAEESSGFALGWSLHMDAEVMNHPDNPSNGSIGIGVVFARGSHGKGYALLLGAEADGDPILSLSVGSGQPSLYTLEGLGAGFHRYEMRYDPLAGDVDVLVDNSLITSAYPGFTHPSYLLPYNTVEWGSGSSADTGHANYSQVVVAFTDRPAVVPEPSTSRLIVGLSLIGILSFLRRGRQMAGQRGQVSRFDK